MGTKLRDVKPKVLTATTQQAMEDAIRQFLEAAGEAELVDVFFAAEGMNLWCLILYIE